MLVLIESDWNLKEKYDAKCVLVCIVLIESDWNLKHEEGIAFSNFDDGINRIRLEFKEVLQDALLSVLSCINRIRLEFKVDTNVFSKYCW